MLSRLWEALSPDHALDTLVMDADVLESLLDSREPTVIYLFANVSDGGTGLYFMAKW